MTKQQNYHYTQQRKKINEHTIKNAHDPANLVTNLLI